MTSLAPMGGTALSHKNIFHGSFGPFEIVEVKKKKEKNGGSLVKSRAKNLIKKKLQCFFKKKLNIFLQTKT